MLRLQYLSPHEAYGFAGDHVISGYAMCFFFEVLETVTPLGSLNLRLFELSL